MGLTEVGQHQPDHSSSESTDEEEELRNEEEAYRIKVWRELPFPLAWG
jgi:hypothetical protein